MIDPNQLSTEEQAALTKQQIGVIGGGVIETYTVPNVDGNPDFRHYKLGNGATGINAGLCRVTIANNPNSWEQMLADDFAAAAPKQED